MVLRFEGQGLARKEAEQASRKTREKIFYVVKSIEGGLNYQVVDNQEEINPLSKVMFRYKNGMIEK